MVQSVIAIFIIYDFIDPFGCFHTKSAHNQSCGSIDDYNIIKQESKCLGKPMKCLDDPGSEKPWRGQFQIDMKMINNQNSVFT